MKGNGLLFVFQTAEDILGVDARVLENLLESDLDAHNKVFSGSIEKQLRLRFRYEQRAHGVDPSGSLIR